MIPLPVQRADQLSDSNDQPRWLVENLWGAHAVGILGGEPKCCKSFLALDIAVSVASGAPCLRQFPVLHPGPVLIFPAEDSLSDVRHRIEGICAAAGQHLVDLPLHVITAISLRLDDPTDRQRLIDTLQLIRPALLILDPFIRLHRIDENSSKEVAPILSYLRTLQRRFNLALVLVHHARKDSHASRPGQALRGSSDLHGWGDSNLYLRRQHDRLMLSVEHRAAPSIEPVPLKLVQENTALSLVVTRPSEPVAQARLAPTERVLLALRKLNRPATIQILRPLCGIRTATLCSTLDELARAGTLCRSPDGFRLAPSSSDAAVSLPLAL